MKTRRVVQGSLSCVACAVAISCGGADASQPEGYVLLDPAARQAGATLEVGDHASTSALPIAVSREDHVVLHAGEREEAIVVGEGELVYIQRARAQATHLKIGTQVSGDQLRLSGDEGGARELASRVGGNVSADGAGWRLRTGSVFAGAAFAGVPAHLDGAAPVLLDGSGEAPPAIGARAVAAPVAPLAAARGQALEPPQMPLSPVAFAAASGCEGVAGQWRGRVYSDRHAAYYDFTLTVAESGASSVKGSVVAETWSASTDEVEPPAACSGTQHVKVVEPASGTVDGDGNLRFDSQSWSVGSHFCGTRITSYSPDRFAVSLASGATHARAVVTDDAVWADGLPVQLTRISCR